MGDNFSLAPSFGAAIFVHDPGTNIPWRGPVFDSIEINIDPFPQHNSSENRL